MAAKHPECAGDGVDSKINACLDLEKFLLVSSFMLGQIRERPVRL
jgi:hypothetical protein